MVGQKLEDVEERHYEAIEETPAEEETDLIDQLSHFHLLFHDISQKGIYISETQANNANDYFPNHESYSTTQRR